MFKLKLVHLFLNILSLVKGVEGVSSGDELDSDEDDDLSPENEGFMGSNGRQGGDGSIAGASGSGSGGQNVRANVVGKRRPNGPAVNRYLILLPGRHPFNLNLLKNSN